MSDPAGARTRDPMLKRHMLYQLSYEIVLNFEGAKVEVFFFNANRFYFYFKLPCTASQMHPGLLLVFIIRCFEWAGISK